MSNDLFKTFEDKILELSFSNDKVHEEEKISFIEKENQIVLPVDYRYFLMNYASTYSGVEAYYRSIEQIPGGSDDGYEWIPDFYHLDDGFYHLGKSIERYEGRMPEEVIPIGQCPGGDQLCICVKGERLGKIYFWDHEHEFVAVNEWLAVRNLPLVEDEWANMYLVAESFTDFILRCEVFEKE